MSGTLRITAEVNVTGPLADERGVRVLEDWQKNTTNALADKAMEMLRAYPMNKTGRARGGFQASLREVRRSVSEVRIPGPTDRGVVWAPWLEGTSKRNTSTGFKGYHLFRKTRTELNKQATDIGQRELDKLLPQIGGT